MPLLYPAIYTVDKPRAYGVAPNVFVTVLKSAPVQALVSSKLPVLFCSAGWHGGTRTHDIRINSPPFYQLDYTPISNETHQFHFVKTYRRLPPQFDKTKLIFFSSSYRKLLFASLCIFKAHHLLLPQKVCNVAVCAFIVFRGISAWSEWWDSNPRPRDPKSRRLPTGVHPDIWWSRRESNPRPKFLHVQNILTQ